MTLEVRPFHSSVDGKDYLYTKNGRYSSLSVVGEGSTSVEPRVLKTKYNSTDMAGGGWIIKQDRNTDSFINILTDKALIDSAEQSAAGVNKGCCCADNATMSRHIEINDCGTKLDLLVKDGKIEKIGKGGVEIGSDLSKLNPVTRKWLKKFIEVAGKVK